MAPGFLLGAGPGILPSGSRRLEGPPARLPDVAATVLARLGVELPEVVTGTPIEGLAQPVEEPPAARPGAL